MWLKHLFNHVVLNAKHRENLLSCFHWLSSSLFLEELDAIGLHFPFHKHPGWACELRYTPALNFPVFLF